MYAIHTSKQRGFTLVEVLISIVVLAVGLVSLAKFQATLLRDSNVARERSEALAIAQDQIEALRNFTTSNQFNAIANSSTTVGPDDVPGLTNTYTIQSTVANASADRKVIDTTVSWYDMQNNTHQVMLSTEVNNVLPSLTEKVVNSGGATSVPTQPPQACGGGGGGNGNGGGGGGGKKK